MGKLHIDMFDTSFTIQTNDDEEYLQKLLKYYKTLVDDLSKIESIKTPLQKSILAGIMLCNELYQEKSKLSDLKEGLYFPPEESISEVLAQKEAESNELEQRTIAMIQKINRVL